MPIYRLKISDHKATEKWADCRGLRYSQWTRSDGFVVVAGSEAEARAAADKEENHGPWWRVSALTSCEVVVDDGKTRVVMGDWPTG